MKRKRRINYKKLALVVGVSCFILIGAIVPFSKGITKYLVENGIIVYGENSQDDSNNEKEEPVEKVSYVGVNEEGKKYTYDAKRVEEKLNSYDYSNNGEKVVFLTFDDGTSKTVTPEILKVLENEGVKATFFITGANLENGGEEARQLLKKEFESGHAIANHSYSHDVKKLYPGRSLDMEAFKADFEKNDKLLKDILGENFSTRVIRCPGGYMSWKNMEPLDNYLSENNMASIDWNALNEDAQGRKKSADELVQRAIKSSEGKEMVVLLMHDTYKKEETAKALPQIIKYFKDNGYVFKTLS